MLKNVILCIDFYFLQIMNTDNNRQFYFLENSSESIITE